MALKSTIYKLQLQLADIDRGVYGEHSLTLARHPSETDERLVMRVLAFAMHAPADTSHGALEFTAGLSDTDAPDLWHRDLSGEIVHWIEVGQPDERRLMKASSRASAVSVIAYASSASLWWGAIEGKLLRAPKVAVWQVESAQSQALAALVERSMRWQITAQDGHLWINDGTRSVEIVPRALRARA